MGLGGKAVSTETCDRAVLSQLGAWRWVLEALLPHCPVVHSGVSEGSFFTHQTSFKFQLVRRVGIYNHG